MTRHQCLGIVFLSILIMVFCETARGEESAGKPDVRPRIVAFGDSLTAGLGIPKEDAYPAQLQQRLDGLDIRYQVINAGVSGDTTAGGVRRISLVLGMKPEIVILELGANDGLRGLSLEQTRSNLITMIEQLQQAGVTVILAGMKLPPNYGEDYTGGFEAIYPSLAKHYQLPLIPFFLAEVASLSALNQADGIHPTKEGYRVVVEQVLKVLRPVISDRNRKTSGDRRSR